MSNDFYYLSKDRETMIHAMEWMPAGQPKAILQICHGMVEHIGRYADFAQYLADAGFYVVGNDHLGHGESVADEEKYGFFHMDRGNEYVIGDMHELKQITTQKYPGVPYFMLGHSMGSFLLRQYIESDGAGLKGAILLGTGHNPAVILKFGRFLCRVEAATKGPMFRSQKIDRLAFGSYNRKFQPARTTHDWLTKDTEIVDRYLDDPRCNFVFTVRAYDQMFTGMELIAQKDQIAKIPKDLPILIASGADDPVGGFGKGVRKVYTAIQKAGVRDLTLQLYPNDRHEILNELDRAQVYQDLKNWMETRI